MARRASSGINAPVIIGVIIAILLLAMGGYALLGGKKEGFSDTTALDMGEYRDNGNSMRGMEYSVEGVIQSRYPRDGGLGLSLEIGESGSNDFLFIVVPDELETINIERDQSYAFKIRFEEGGVAIAQAVQRL